MHKNNHCFLVGNLGSDPVERAKSEKSSSIVGFTVAENVQTFDRDSNTFKTVHTNWFNITAFGSVAERVKKALKKGDRVAIQGTMRVSKFTDKTGAERTGFEIVADDVALWKTLGSVAGDEHAEVHGSDRGHERVTKIGGGPPSRGGGRGAIRAAAAAPSYDEDEELPF